MFKFLTDSIENVLDIGDVITSGEVPTKKQVAKLVADGVSVAAIAVAADVGVDVIQELLDE